MDDIREKDPNVQSEYDKENSIEPNGAGKESSEADYVKATAAERSFQDKAHKGRLAKLEKELEYACSERDSFKDSYQRTFSDYNNYKKRTQSAVSQAIKTGMGDAIEKILPILDNLERAMEHTEDKESALSQGVAMVCKQFVDTLSCMGVSEIPALGVEFDPNLHQAIQQIDAKEGDEPGTVAQVARKGYMLDDRVLRHSMVIVNK